MLYYHEVYLKSGKIEYYIARNKAQHEKMINNAKSINKTFNTIDIVIVRTVKSKTLYSFIEKE